MDYIITPENVPAEMRGKAKNMVHRELINSETHNANMTLWDVRAPKDTGAPMLVHPHDETMTVLSGRIVARIGEARVEAAHGQTIFMPAAVPHGFRIIEDAHLLICFPVGDVQFEYVESKYNR